MQRHENEKWVGRAVSEEKAQPGPRGDAAGAECDGADVFRAEYGGELLGDELSPEEKALLDSVPKGTEDLNRRAFRH